MDGIAKFKKSEAEQSTPIFCFFSEITSLHKHIGNPACRQRKQHNVGKVKQKPFHAQDNFQRAEIGDLGCRAGDHESGGAAHAHAVPEPRL